MVASRENVAPDPLVDSGFGVAHNFLNVPPVVRRLKSPRKKSSSPKKGGAGAATSPSKKGGSRSPAGGRAKSPSRSPTKRSTSSPKRSLAPSPPSSPSLATAAKRSPLRPPPPPALIQIDAGDGDGEELLANGPSLQDAFKRFRKQRTGQKKEAIKLKKEADKARRRNPNFQQRLREKFLKQAMSYLGVPYSKKWHEKENCTCEGCTELNEQLYDRPLHLDCCALVRRCVKDLKADFGFQLGVGNQCYQFDTLPIRVDSVHELEPGDLIFYEGEYYNPKARRPLHDMVHVEIFTGSGKKGEGCIGSREQKKWIKCYDDYRIEESKRWRLIRYHFCKIDTWLAGTLRSFCEEHSWKSGSKGFHPPKGTKKSLFAAEDEGDGEGDGESEGEEQEADAEAEVGGDGDDEEPKYVHTYNVRRDHVP